MLTGLQDVADLTAEARGRLCPRGVPPMEWDAALRCSDLIRQAIVDGFPGYWVAVRLSDGGSDGIHYVTRTDAIRYQLHSTLVAVVKVPLDDMSPKAAESFLRVHRAVYNAGHRMVDPEADREIIVPSLVEQAERFIARYNARKGTL